jgi:hypothetical protein
MHPTAAPRQEFGLRTQRSPGVTRSALRTMSAPALPVHRDAFVAFVGPNADRFLPTFDKMQERDPGLKGIVRGWCWPAFFVPLPWLLYRKQWAMAAAVIAVPIVLAYLFHSSRVSLGLAVATAMTGKSVYVMDAARKIRKLCTQERDPIRQRERIAQAGGVSVAGAVLGALIIVAAIAAVVFAKLVKV